MSDNREQFEAWMKSLSGYPFAGQFANLMWSAWQAARATQADHISQARAAVIVPVELLTDLIDDVRDYAESRSFKDREARWRTDLIARASALLPAPPEKPAGDVSDI